MHESLWNLENRGVVAAGTTAERREATRVRHHLRAAYRGCEVRTGAELANRFPILAAMELVAAAKSGPIVYPERWVIWFYRHATARSRRIVSKNLYTILGGDLCKLDRVVETLTHEHRGWGRSMRRGVYMFLRKVPQSVKVETADEVIGEFTIRELASLAHVKGRGSW